MTVDAKTGVRYRVTHDRAYGPEQNSAGDYLRSQKGGRTVVEIVDDDDRVIATGEAITHPSENYNRKLGRTIALGRALKALQAAPVLPPSLSLVEFADLMMLATREADSAGICFVHFDGGDRPAPYVLFSMQRYRDTIDRLLPGGKGIAADDPEWRHSHVEPEMLRDAAVVGG